MKVFTAWAVVHGAVIVAFLLYGQATPGFAWKQYLWLLPIVLRFALYAYARSASPRVSSKALAWASLCVDCLLIAFFTASMAWDIPPRSPIAALVLILRLAVLVAESLLGSVISFKPASSPDLTPGAVTLSPLMRSIVAGWAIACGAGVGAFLAYGAMTPGFEFARYPWLIPIACQGGLCAYLCSARPRLLLMARISGFLWLAFVTISPFRAAAAGELIGLFLCLTAPTLLLAFQQAARDQVEALARAGPLPPPPTGRRASPPGTGRA